MKLYTEEQVKHTLQLMGESYLVNEFLKTAQPIELPSDEEIENNAYTDRRVDDWEHDQQVGFEQGAKWIKEQILNQNK
jgi:hypothetical protein